MEKIIKIGEYELAAKSTAASLFSYKANFGRDGLRDLMSLTTAVKSPDGKNMDAELFDVDVFFRFLWVFAKAADAEIPPLEHWLEGFDVPPLDFVTEALPQMMELLSSTAGGTIKPKNAKAAAGKRK